MRSLRTAQAEPGPRMILWLALALGSGCGQLLGIGDFTDEDAPSSGQGGSGDGGGGGGGGGAGVCTPGSSESCYGGPEGTEAVGSCKAGTHVCNEDGTGHGECFGEVLPAAETCLTAADDDCDGETNEDGTGCLCVPGASVSCYSGTDATEGVGICLAGTTTCGEDGTAVLPGCAGEVLPGVEDCTKPEDEDCSGLACAQPLWSKMFGSIASQTPDGIAADSLGNVLVAGGFSGSLPFGPAPLVSAGLSDAFVAKLDTNGDHVWSKSFGSSQNESAHRVRVDGADNVLLTGGFFGSIGFGGGVLTSAGSLDVFVAKLDASGNRLWERGFGNASPDSVDDLAVDASGNVFLAGTFSGSVDFGAGALVSAGGTDIFLVKISGATGATLWSKRFGGTLASQVDQIHALATDPLGNVVLGGGFGGAVAFGGPVLTPKLVNATDAFVVELDGLGNHLWSQSFGGAGSQSVTVLVTAPDGSVVMGGEHNGGITINGAKAGTTVPPSQDLFMARYSSAGLYLWHQTYSSLAADVFTGLAIDANGSILAGGTANDVLFFDENPIDPSLFLLKLDALGTYVWARGFGGGFSTLVAAGPTNEALLACATSGTVDFGLGPLGGPGTVAVAKLAP